MEIEIQVADFHTEDGVPVDIIHHMADGQLMDNNLVIISSINSG
ncbi:hypothetical protein P4K82_25955 [Bacillus cereus]|nr:hypothetical protein [Bacillus cereus]